MMREVVKLSLNSTSGNCVDDPSRYYTLTRFKDMTDYDVREYDHKNINRTPLIKITNVSFNCCSVHIHQSFDFSNTSTLFLGIFSPKFFSP